ncbi:MAG TPA: DUF1850 domain-containing protein [Pseudolabrys sp.]|nr:DUF1850 domain-containing protein [Pseudolabrys sp.]
MLGAMCIAFAAGSATVVLPTDKITLSWVHTVERTPWEEDYAIENGALVIKEARVKRSGAGMDPPDDATWHDGWWHYRPSIGPLPEVLLANSPFAAGYTICWGGRCRPLNELTPVSTQVKLFATHCETEQQ